MRKTLLSALVASAFALGGSAFAGPLTLDLTGSGNVISADSLDWSPTSFLARGGVAAISAFDAGATGDAVKFNVLTHAKLVGYSNSAGTFGLPGSFAGEITIITSFEERVIGTSGNQASFETTGKGFVEMYYSATANSDNLRGANFNDGRVIMHAEGVSDSSGNFTVNNKPPTKLDGFGADDYTGQMTVSGIGVQDEITFGVTNVALDKNFLKTAILDFSLLFENISIGLPYKSVNPSDCFNPNMSLAMDSDINGGTVAAGSQTTQCNATNHLTGTYAANFANLGWGNDGGYVPVVGTTNGLFGTDPDFVAQTDFNSAVTGKTPEPGTLALLGLALAGVGLTTVRRRK